MEMDIKQLALAVRTIAEEKNLPEDTVQEIVEQALAAAYRRDFGDREQEVRVSMNLNSGEIDVYVSKEVVETVEDDAVQISQKDASVINKSAKVGDTVELHEKPETFGRVAAQTAKQVVLQRLREAERDIVMEEYEDKIGTIVNGIVNRVEGNIVRIDLGKAQGIMPRSEQIQGEHYYPGQRVKVFLKDVEKGFRGPQLVVSRGSKDFIELLFRAEVPEMENGSVEIKGIAREGGVRSKIAVASTVQGVDPVGTFVGGHGTRVNAVMSEVGEQEKIDIVVWDEDPVAYIINALSPTNVTRVEVEGDRAKVIVPEDQLSIAIGRGGQNVRLASKLTGYEIDLSAEQAVPEVPTKPAAPKLKKKEQLESSLLDAIEEHGQDSTEE
ncbi:transcription termination/antitermination protein NusA [Candidatus Saccharibacteria bacterium]|nr:transcription termination/antitermination protein NusA [Candidatus Saccharibacteria bacterium]